MSQNYQNEKSPILNGQKSPKYEGFRGTYLIPHFFQHHEELLIYILILIAYFTK